MGIGKQRWLFGPVVSPSASCDRRCYAVQQGQRRWSRSIPGGSTAKLLLRPTIRDVDVRQVPVPRCCCAPSPAGPASCVAYRRTRAAPTIDSVQCQGADERADARTRNIAAGPRPDVDRGRCERAGTAGVADPSPTNTWRTCGSSTSAGIRAMQLIPRRASHTVGHPSGWRRYGRCRVS